LLYTGLKGKFRGAPRPRHHLIGGDLALISCLILVFDAVIMTRNQTIPLGPMWLEEKCLEENTFHLNPACKTFSHAMQQNLEILVERKGKARRKWS
jgi:hypothetical protein